MLRKEPIMNDKAFQDYYPKEFSYCYGCGPLNDHGLKIKSRWDGDESVCRYEPQPYHSGGFPDSVYGGFLASLIDCHSSATASAAHHRDQGFSLDEKPLSRFVTASLKVDYLKPTPMNTVLELRSNVVEIKGRKVIVFTQLSAAGTVCVKGEAVMVRIPEKSEVK
jgi:acyl-coenzyme A thioesterase PaaI-like protein